MICDDLSAHKTHAVRDWLAAHPRVTMHYTPTYSSWLNQVELWFAKIERDCIARGIFSSTTNLRRKLMQYIRYLGGANLYAYVGGQVLEATDPSGLIMKVPRSKDEGFGGGGLGGGGLAGIGDDLTEVFGTGAGWIARAQARDRVNAYHEGKRIERLLGVIGIEAPTELTISTPGSRGQDISAQEPYPGSNTGNVQLASYSEAASSCPQCLAIALRLGMASPAIVSAVHKAQKAAQGALVSWGRVGNFLRGTWTKLGDDGASYVNWTRFINRLGRTEFLFKDRYGPNGTFLGRDWYWP